MTDARDIHTDISVLLSDREWGRLAERLPRAMTEADYAPSDIHAEIVDLTCEPDNVLVNQYESIEGRIPLMPVQRIVVNGRSALDLREATQVIVSHLPESAYWCGTSGEGPLTPGIAAACAWQHA